MIAGGSSDTDEFAKELKEMAKGDDRILFTGFVQGQALEELYNNAYVYTLPSDMEGMPFESSGSYELLETAVWYRILRNVQKW